ncbi:rRNA maturation RNase YbeY [Muriicola sp.]|uniref:rRNA maturation RNase YbeY n=1 Tax=Muriicola sp. TaxID=2020856 RepID=UPI003566DFB8
MIEYNFKTQFVLKNKRKYTDWLKKVINGEGFVTGDISYVFTSDEELLQINKEYLNHHDYTDIITFDYTSNKRISGDIFISIDRVKENAVKYKVQFEEELRRVMIHGILHLMGLKDKTTLEKSIMTAAEDNKLQMFHVEP